MKGGASSISPCAAHTFIRNEKRVSFIKKEKKTFIHERCTDQMCLGQEERTPESWGGHGGEGCTGMMGLGPA